MTRQIKNKNQIKKKALSIRGLYKSYKKKNVIQDLNLYVEEAECVALLGPNGAGKTTSIKTCLGLCQADKGDIQVLGHPIPKESLVARQKLGILAQKDTLDPDFNCHENLAIYARYFGIPSSKIKKQIPKLLKFAGIETKEKEKISHLSGGMQRRLSLARILVNDPKLIFLDEPTTGLDPQARHLIWERLRLLQKQGKTIFLTTHFMEEAERLCNRIYIMDHSKIISEGSPKDLLEKHVEKYVVEIYGETQMKKKNIYQIKGVKRVETFGESSFAYCQDTRALLRFLHKQKIEKLAYKERPSNLEDVFLKLTGRDLRE